MTSALAALLAADAVYFNGNVVTFGAADPAARALAVKDGRVLAVGSDAEIRGLAGPSTETVDLNGKTVLPGINDSHMHAALTGGTRPPLTLDVGYPAVRSIADIKQAVRERAAAVRPGEWVRGAGWNEGYLEECLADRSRHMTRWDLDEAAPDNPVYLVSFTQHELVANSRALEIAGVGPDTQTETGSEIVKDAATGQPTGMLLELPAEGLIMRVVPPWSRDDKRRAILSIMKDLNARGITSATDAALGPGGAGFQGGFFDAECISVYNDLHNEDLLTVRMNLLYLFGSYGAISLKDFEKSIPEIGIHSGFGDEWLKIGGIKLFADGIPQTKTAWLREDYPDGGNGSLVLPGATDEERCEELARMIEFAHRHNFQCAIHAVGDRAIQACVDGFVRAESADPRGLRHYLVHCDLITPADIARVVQHGIGVSTQPILKWVFSDSIDQAIGLERSAWQFPLRTLLDAGVHVSLSSDSPVSEPDWIQGVEAAVLRKSKASGTVRGPEQRITAREAVRLYTMGGAWQDHMEKHKGSLEPGKLADFCVLDRDILSVPSAEIHTIKNVATVVGGRRVFEDGL
jgi:predicted amidohydrolase YtcJ